MKIKSFIVCVFLFLLSYFTSAQTTVVPDINFEEYLETHAADGSMVDIGDASSMGDGIANNGLVFTDRIAEVVLIDVSNLGIEDLSGIEDFSALETLFCSNNSLSVLDISNNTNLLSIVCGSNDLSDIDISNNLNIETLDCSENQLQAINTTVNLELKSLNVSGNQISSIDVSENQELSVLNISDNRITDELIVMNNANLESLFCASNQISIIDLSSNVLLRDLDISDNSVTNLDLSFINSVVCPDPQTDPITDCQNFGIINVSRNDLISLIVNNGFNELISVFDSSTNPDLFCIQIDSGFTPSGWIKDDWTYYSDTTCVDIYTYVPDDNFEQALINLGYDNELDNLVLTSNISSIVDLDVSNNAIESLEGIEDFTILEVLDASNNTINNVDLSNNLSLQEINFENNNLEIFSTSENVSLVTINCANNAIGSIDLSANITLNTLNISGNALLGLDISLNTLLTTLDCSDNQIESLNLSANSNLTSIQCNDNNLFALNISNGNNPLIATLNAINNSNLFCVRVDDVAFANGAAGWQKDANASYELDCGTYVPDDNFEQALIDQGIDSDGILNNFVPTSDVIGVSILDVSALNIEDLTGIEDFIALVELNVSNNFITSLDLSSSTNLEALDCSINQIQDLDLSSNLNLISLLCNYNELETLNIANGNNAALTVFNCTDNVNLFCINVDNTILVGIPVSWQKDPFANYNDDCLNNRFTLIPDNNFEQALIDLGYDDVIDGQVLTSNIEHIENINVSDKSITDLTGIRDFQSLIELDCSNNFLDQLDISDMINLERLNCSSNYLLTNDGSITDGLFNFDGTISLRELFCSNNNLADLNTTQNINLERLDCSNNNLVDLNISGNTFLVELNCSNNDLIDLDVSNNSVLENLNCDNNAINNLITTVLNNTALLTISCANNELSDLLINNYGVLQTLNADSNELTQINVTSNLNLSFLSVTNNQISEIDLQNNVDLVDLLVSQNNLAELNLTSNIQLKQLNCAFNEIIELDLNSNLLVEQLTCSNNELVSLSLINNTNLIEVNSSSNMLSTIILSSNLGALKRLDLSGNQIEGGIDLSSMAVSSCTYQPNQTEYCPETIAINLSNNLLDYVNIQNGINIDVIDFNTTDNPNLECIQIDDVNAIGSGWVKDAVSQYSEDCNFGETYVPDDNFEQALINLGYDSGPLNDYVLTSNIQSLISLDISGNSIVDLTGVEDFVALENLNVSNNSVAEVDLSSNVNLLNLDASNNQLDDLDVSNNTLLQVLNCSDNIIGNLDLTSNSSLTDLNIASNNFTSFSPSDVLTLEVFNCDDNLITELNFQQNISLTDLICQFNVLETLNIQNGQNNLLTNLNATNNPNLNCIQTDTGTVPTGATWTIDATAQFAIECFFGQTFVPDDNFEQALIDLGYDSGLLDDYVLTENIEDIEFLNISSSEIIDLTGIEDFMSLSILDAGDNLITMVDFSNNNLLSNLDMSGNLIDDIDVTVLPDLTTLDVSGNSLTQLDVSANPNLVNLDLSNNEVSEIDIFNLSGIVNFNCAFNQINNLDFTQNPNLNILFCQSNELVGDQLNLQNGNNENLQIFNASNNPGLGCILVDDPIAVINNTDGTYDNWVKDNSATYQVICEDADNDGVPNDEDLCPGTEFGAPVDLFGCAIIDLSNDNFLITITGETCLNSNNGKIRIEALQLYNYTVSLFSEDIIETTGEDFYQEYNFTNDVDIFNLLAGTYDMCITIEEWPDYESCYTVVITEPDPLEVFASRTASGNEMSVNMSGSSSFNIEFNDQIFTTHNSNLSLPLKDGLNYLKVSTDLDCQGIFVKQIIVSDDFIMYPNPFNAAIYILNGSPNTKVEVHIFNTFGQLIFSKEYMSNDSEIRLDTNDLDSGIYMITAKSKSTTTTYKMVKK